MEYSPSAQSNPFSDDRAIDPTASPKSITSPVEGSVSRKNPDHMNQDDRALSDTPTVTGQNPFEADNELDSSPTRTIDSEQREGSFDFEAI